MFRKTSLRLLAAVAAFVMPSAIGGELVPFRSSGVAQLLGPIVPGEGVQAVDIGRATHLGNFESRYDLQVEATDGFLVFTGTFTSTVSSGDTITFGVEVVVSMATGAFEGEFTAIGGTGRFKGISGGLVATSGMVDPFSGLFWHESKGLLPSVGATKR